MHIVPGGREVGRGFGHGILLDNGLLGPERHGLGESLLRAVLADVDLFDHEQALDEPFGHNRHDQHVAFLTRLRCLGHLTVGCHTFDHQVTTLQQCLDRLVNRSDCHAYLHAARRQPASDMQALGRNR